MVAVHPVTMGGCGMETITTLNTALFLESKGPAKV